VLFQLGTHLGGGVGVGGPALRAEQRLGMGRIAGAVARDFYWFPGAGQLG
jgi:hypothetical protein